MMMLNPDQKYVDEMYEAIEKNNGYCPCIIKKSEDTICPCKDFRESNKCHCLLYVEG